MSCLFFLVAEPLLFEATMWHRALAIPSQIRVSC
jgi:hypothetical protein